MVCAMLTRMSLYVGCIEINCSVNRQSASQILIQREHQVVDGTAFDLIRLLFFAAHFVTGTLGLLASLEGLHGLIKLTLKVDPANFIASKLLTESKSSHSKSEIGYNSVRLEYLVDTYTFSCLSLEISC